MFSRLLMRPRCEVQSATESSQICTTRTALAALEQGVGHAVVLWAIAEAIELSMESRGRPRRIDRRRGVPFASGVLRLSALPGPRVVLYPFPLEEEEIRPEDHTQYQAAKRRDTI